MLQKNQVSQGTYLFATDTTASPPIGKTGDQTNITGHWSADGGADASFTTTHPTEVGHGVYWQPLAQAETNGNRLAFSWSSTTTGITVESQFADTVITLTPPGIRKNVGINGFEFPMIDSANRPDRKTGVTVTSTRSIDGAAFAPCTNSAAENATTGFYVINLSASDLNGTTIGLLFTAPGCDDTYVEILTQP